MNRLAWLVSMLLAGTNLGRSFAEEVTEETAARRGERAARTVSSPLSASLQAYETLWKRWGLPERPENYSQAVAQRYGLHDAPFDNNSMPLGLHEFDGPLGKGIASSCLMCHSGRIAGQTIIGLGNANFDFQSLYEDLSAGDVISLPLPIKLANGRGVIEASAGTIYMLQFRDSEMNIRTREKLTVRDDLCQDIPAWWHRKRKETMFHTGSTDARSVRANLSFLLAPVYSGEAIKNAEPTFADIKEYIFSIESPKYPFEVDEELAAGGQPIFRKNCAKCHGTYGPDGKYPNRIVAAKTVGTDSTLIDFHPEEDSPYYEKSWLFREESQEGEPYARIPKGYQAPPLDGIWATAPYLHNASVPTVYHVLNSKARPAIYTRSYRAEEEDYDKAKLGWKITPLEKMPDDLSEFERRKMFDASSPGRGNQGHTFGDKLTDEERMAVIEYLKTL